MTKLVSSFRHGLIGLGRWFERQKRVLPWRDQPTVYRVWISEIMLQQTQVATVVPYFERFLARFPDVRTLAEAPEPEVLRLWAGLGYYSRARNLHRAAQKIVKTGFPSSREEWLEIPGVGQYTAGAILSIASDRPEVILDGNVERVLSRVRRVGRERGDGEFKARLWRLSRIFVERGVRLGVRPSVLNQALMELGATVCSPRKPRCAECPLAGICRAHQAQVAEQYPPRRKPKEWLEVRETLHCVLDGQGRVLLRLRQKGEWRAGLWDFVDQAPMVGEVAETLGNVRRVGTLESRHVVTRHRVLRTTEVWCFSPKKGSQLWQAGENLRPDLQWVSAEDPEVAVGSPLRKTLRQISERWPECFLLKAPEAARRN